MPWARPTYSDLRQRVLGAMAASLPGSDPFQRRTVLNVMGTVLAKMGDEQLGYLDWQLQQSIPYTSSGEYLIGWAGLRDINLENAAVATGNVVFSGTPGKPVFGALQLLRSDGFLYTVPNGGIIGSNGTTSIPVSALVAGAAGNADPGTPLQLATNLSGINLTAVVDSAGITGGADQETMASLKTRMLQRYAQPPQGGARADYVGWALGVPGVTRAWSYSAGNGVVVVYFMMDDVRPATFGLPQGINGRSQFENRGTLAARGDQLAVADGIFSLQAADALVYAVAPKPVYQALTLSEVPADATVQAAIVTAYQAFIAREAAPGGVWVETQNPDGSITRSPGGVVRVSHLDAAIEAVPGLDHFVRVIPTADIVVPLGNITLPGPVSFV